MKDKPDRLVWSGIYLCADFNKPGLGVSPEAETNLREYAWPGNVRELQNCIERAVILCDTADIQPRHLNLAHDDGIEDGADVADPWDQIDVSGSLDEASRRVHDEFERHKLRQSLKEARGNRDAAAAALKISPRDLAIKLKHYRIG